MGRLITSISIIKNSEDEKKARTGLEETLQYEWERRKLDITIPCKT